MPFIFRRHEVGLLGIDHRRDPLKIELTVGPFAMMDVVGDDAELLRQFRLGMLCTAENAESAEKKYISLSSLCDLRVLCGQFFTDKVGGGRARGGLRIDDTMLLLGAFAIASDFAGSGCYLALH